MKKKRGFKNSKSYTEDRYRKVKDIGKSIFPDMGDNEDPVCFLSSSADVMVIATVFFICITTKDTAKGQKQTNKKRPASTDPPP